MPGHPSPVNPDLDEQVRRTIADVLMVELVAVVPDAALFDDLGGESIDILDLLFRLEEVIGVPMPVTRWDDYIRQQLGGNNPKFALTVDMVQDFAAEQVGSRTLSSPPTLA